MFTKGPDPIQLQHSQNLVLLLGPQRLQKADHLEQLEILRGIESPRDQRRMRSPARAGHVFSFPLRPLTRAVSRENELTLA